jgi:hypothetical protein
MWKSRVSVQGGEPQGLGPMSMVGRHGTRTAHANCSLQVTSDEEHDERVAWAACNCKASVGKVEEAVKPA